MQNFGPELQRRLFGTEKYQAGSNYRVAEADAVLKEEKNIKKLVQSLGEGALLHGKGSTPVPA